MFNANIVNNVLQIKKVLFCVNHYRESSYVAHVTEILNFPSVRRSQETAERVDIQ